jgi:predicted  nucleic acid-binding Zn-ribbon protein
MLQKTALSDLELEERAAEARSLLANKLLAEIFKEAQDTFVDMLRTEQIGSSRANSAQAGLQALEHIHNALKKPISDQKMRLNRVPRREPDV